MAKTVAQKVTDALTDQFPEQFTRAVKGRFGIRVTAAHDHMGVVTPERDDGQGVSREAVRYGQAFQDGYLAATQVAAEAAYTRRS